MRSRWTVNLLLLIAVALLSYEVRRALEQDRHVATLTELKPGAITEIRLERPASPLIELQRDNGDWRMETPYRTAANAARIEQLVRIASTQVFRSLHEADAPERLGLKPQGMQLSLDGVVLRFGDTDPIDHHRYVAVAGQVHMIGDGFQHHLSAPAEDYVSPRLLPGDFAPAFGTLVGQVLDDPSLAELGKLTAERVVALGEDEIEGRLLDLSEAGNERNLRLLVSADARRWIRLDLRLVYLLANPPFWAIATDETAQEAAEGSEDSSPAFSWP